MRGRFFTIFSAVSLALCLALTAVWVRSYWRQELYSNSYGYHVCSVSMGTVVLSRPLRGPPQSQVPNSFSLLGFEYRQDYVPIDLPESANPVGAQVTYEEVLSQCFTVPCWFLCTLTAVLPALWLWRYWRDRSVRSDGMPHCAKCEYNLTGNVSGTCPECGTSIPADLMRRPVA